eukprot:COSAG01_NODE_24_length_37608_cov_19.303154_39_plen_219_part_00
MACCCRCRWWLYSPGVGVVPLSACLCCDLQYTLNKKFLTIIPIVLFLLTISNCGDQLGLCGLQYHLRNIITRPETLGWLRFTYDVEIGSAELCYPVRNSGLAEIYLRCWDRLRSMVFFCGWAGTRSGAHRACSTCWQPYAPPPPPPPSPAGQPPSAAPDEAFLVGSVPVSSVDRLSWLTQRPDRPPPARYASPRPDQSIMIRTESEMSRNVGESQPLP